MLKGHWHILSVGGFSAILRFNTNKEFVLALDVGLCEHHEEALDEWLFEFLPENKGFVIVDNTLVATTGGKMVSVITHHIVPLPTK